MLITILRYTYFFFVLVPAAFILDGLRKIGIGDDLDIEKQ